MMRMIVFMEMMLASVNIMMMIIMLMMMMMMTKTTIMMMMITMIMYILAMRRMVPIDVIHHSELSKEMKIATLMSVMLCRVDTVQFYIPSQIT